RSLLHLVLAVNRRIPSYHASRHPNLVPSFFEPVTTAEVGTAPNGGTTVEATVLEGQHSLRGLPRSTDSETSRDSPWSAPRRRLSWQCIAAVNGEVGSGQSAASVTFVQVTTVVTTTDQGRFAALLAMLATSAANGTGTRQDAITNAAGQSLTPCDNAWLEGTQRQVIPAPAPPPPRPNAALGGLRLEDFVNVTNPGMAALGALMAASAGTIQSAVGASVGASAAASAAGGGGPSGAGNAVRGAQRLAYYTKLGPPNPDGDDGGGGGFTTGRLGFSRRRPGLPPPPPTYQVAIGFVAAEPIEAFTDARLADISTSVAAESGVDPSQVTTVAYAASTPEQLVSRALSEVLASDADSSEGAVGAARVEITIVTTDSSASAAVEESLSASVFADANATSEFLNLQVTSEPDVAAETVTYEDEEGEVQENVSLMLGAALVDTVTSLGSIFCLITAFHYAILFWWYMYANRKYYAYHAAQRAQKAAEEAAATPQERKAKALLMAKSRRIFDQFDQDGSGFVSTSEVTRMVKMLKLGLTRSQVQEMVSTADLDMSGQMSFEEFLDFVKSYKGSSTFFQRLSLFGHLGRAGRIVTLFRRSRVAPSAEPLSNQTRMESSAVSSPPSPPLPPEPVPSPLPTGIREGDISAQLITRLFARMQSRRRRHYRRPHHRNPSRSSSPLNSGGCRRCSECPTCKTFLASPLRRRSSTSRPLSSAHRLVSSMPSVRRTMGTTSSLGLSSSSPCSGTYIRSGGSRSCGGCTCP
ncbi:troponin c, partial [Chrysochromulina tobinii]